MTIVDMIDGAVRGPGDAMRWIPPHERSEPPPEPDIDQMICDALQAIYAEIGQCLCERPAPWLIYDANGHRRWCGHCGGELR